MVFSCLKAQDEDSNRSHQIDKQLNREKKNDVQIIKLLLLGAGEAGKTTIIKQMRILHIRSFTDRERIEKVTEIRQSLHECIYNVAVYIQNSDDFKNCSDVTQFADYIIKWGEPGPSEFTSEYFDNISRLWKDSYVQEYFTPEKFMLLIDCAKYFLNRLDDIRQNNYVPNEQDILRSRKRTTVTQKLEFKVKTPRSYGKRIQEFWMYDVGGQRGERRKWIQVFAGVHAILFLVACSEFDQVLRENENCNRLRESLKLFGEIWTSRFLLSSGFILFLNKQDVLKDKVDNGIKIAKYFAEYTAYKSLNKYPNEFTYVRNFIQQKFMDITNTPRDVKLVGNLGRSSSLYINQECYCHFTIATDTNHIKTVFEDVHSIILVKILREVGLN